MPIAEPAKVRNSAITARTEPEIIPTGGINIAMKASTIPATTTTNEDTSEVNPNTRKK